MKRQGSLTLTLTAAELRALAEHTSPDLGREHLQNVLFEGERGLCVATDGHVMVIRFGEPFDGKWFLRGSTVREIARVAGYQRLVDLSRDLATFRGEPTFSMPLEAKSDNTPFPPFETAIVGSESGSPVRVEIKRIKRITRTLELLNAAGCDGVTMQTFGEREPIRMWATGPAAEWLVVFMPTTPEDSELGAQLVGRLKGGGR